MKIIYYSPHPTHDIVSEVGYSTHQRETINAMKNLGHDVLPIILGGMVKSEVLDFHAALASETGLKKWLKKIIPRWIKNTIKDIQLIRHDVRAANTLKSAILEFSPDLIYERGEYLQNKGTLVAKALGIRHFLEINSPCVSEMRSFEGPSLLHFLGLKKEKSKMQNTNFIFAVSSALRTHIKHNYNPTVPIEVIPNCINPEMALPPNADIENIRKKYNLEGKSIIGFVGSIFPHHGIDKLIRAFETVNKRHPESHLIIVGDGILREKYELLASATLVQGSYTFTGKVQHCDVLKYVGVFDIAVMPDSNWYGSPIKIFEYGLMKKLIIAPDLGPLKDVMEDGIHGVLIGAKMEDLSMAIENILSNKEKYREMGTNFYDRIQNNYTWERQSAFILSKF